LNDDVFKRDELHVGFAMGPRGFVLNASGKVCRSALVDVRDAKIVAKLMDSCRVPLREIGEHIEVSAAAVHKRMLGLEEQGVIQRYRCLVHPALLGAQPLEVYGRCARPLTQAVCDALGEHPSVFEVTVASHDHAYVTCLLRPEESTEALLRHFEHVAGLRDASVRTYDLGRAPQLALSPLDCRLIRALAYHARRPLSEVARKLDETEAMVAQRLLLLEEAHALVFTVELGTAMADGHWAVLEMETRSALTEGLQALIEGTSTVLWTTRFADASNVHHAWIWSATSGAMQRTRELLLSDERVVSATPSLVVASRIYPVWIQEALRVRGEVRG
jgi:DNA-binding Lrp family transcriptional regulator